MPMRPAQVEREWAHSCQRERHVPLVRKGRATFTRPGRRASVLEEAVSELGDSAQFVVGDVSKSGGPKAIVDEVIARHDPRRRPAQSQPLAVG